MDSPETVEDKEGSDSVAEDWAHHLNVAFDSHLIMPCTWRQAHIVIKLNKPHCTNFTQFLNVRRNIVKVPDIFNVEPDHGHYSSRVFLDIPAQ